MVGKPFYLTIISDVSPEIRNALIRKLDNIDLRLICLLGSTKIISTGLNP